VVLDLFSRLVVGWAMAAIQDATLVTQALHMAVTRRRPQAGLLHHCDRGSTYTSSSGYRTLSWLSWGYWPVRTRQFTKNTEGMLLNWALVWEKSHHATSLRISWDIASLSVTRGTVSDLRDKTIEYDQLTIKQEQLEQRFTDLREQIQQRFTSIEEQLQSLLAQSQQNAPEEPQITEEQRISEIEQRYQQQIEELERQIATYQQKEMRSIATSKSKSSKKKTQAKKLPASLASRSAFAQLHGVPDGTVASACSSGKVASVNGTWIYNSRTIHQALGDRGKHDFYQVFHTRPDFKPCAACPHKQPV